MIILEPDLTAKAEQQLQFLKSKLENAGEAIKNSPSPAEMLDNLKLPPVAAADIKLPTALNNTFQMAADFVKYNITQVVFFCILVILHSEIQLCIALIIKP